MIRQTEALNRHMKELREAETNKKKKTDKEVKVNTNHKRRMMIKNKEGSK